MDPITQFLSGFALLGIPAVVLIPMLVEGAKRLGLPARYAGLASMLIGMLVAALIGGVEAWPAITPWVRVLLGGLLLGLASSGAYSQYRALKPPPAG
jgi:hypothetical protein